MAGEAEEPVREIVASAKRLVQALEATAGKLDATIGQLETGVGEVAAAATGALDHARRLLRENESDIRAALLAARAATENLQRAAAKIADRPSTLLFDSEDETSKAARERRDFERLLRDRGRANRHGKE
jgi:ABC-type transporter Mla subunit MlaD